jgi:DNA-binding transcriptional ArsR family regulator
VWPQGPIITTIAETDPDMNDKDISQLDQSADEASHLLKGLANPVRLKILCQMLEGERSVGEIAANIGIRDTLASQHLSLLRRGGVVAARREAQTIFYRVDSDAVRRLLAVLHDVFCGAPSVQARRTRRK